MDFIQIHLQQLLHLQLAKELQSTPIAVIVAVVPAVAAPAVPMWVSNASSMPKGIKISNNILGCTTANFLSLFSNAR